MVESLNELVAGVLDLGFTWLLSFGFCFGVKNIQNKTVESGR